VQYSQPLLTLSLQEIRLHLWVCKEKCKYFRKHGRMKYRRKHLNERLKAAQDHLSGDVCLNYAMGKHYKWGRGVRVVHSENEFGADSIEHNTKAGVEVEEAIWNEIHKKRFFRLPSWGSSNLSREAVRRLRLLCNLTHSQGYTEWYLRLSQQLLWDYEGVMWRMLSNTAFGSG